MKTIRNVMLIGLLLILALPVAAQRKVKFGIFDKATEQPVIGAVITYADNEKLKSPQRVVTNMNGEATISVPQSDKYQRGFPFANGHRGYGAYLGIAEVRGSRPHPRYRAPER